MLNREQYEDARTETTENFEETNDNFDESNEILEEFLERAKEEEYGKESEKLEYANDHALFLTGKTTKYGREIEIKHIIV